MILLNVRLRKRLEQDFDAAEHPCVGQLELGALALDNLVSPGLDNMRRVFMCIGLEQIRSFIIAHVRATRWVHWNCCHVYASYHRYFVKHTELIGIISV